MVWNQRKSPGIWGLEKPRTVISALYFTICFLHLAAVHVVITAQTTCKSAIALLLSFTIFRLWAISVLLPLYILQVFLCLLPTILGNAWCLIFPWDRLIENTESYRRQWAMLAQLQLEGKYNFRDDEILRVERSGKQWMDNVLWDESTEEFAVCGARVRFVHLKPASVKSSNGGSLPKRPIVFLHGSRGWSYTWRKVCLNSFLSFWMTPVPGGKPRLHTRMVELLIATITGYAQTSRRWS